MRGKIRIFFNLLVGVSELEVCSYWMEAFTVHVGWWWGINNQAEKDLSCVHISQEKKELRMFLHKYGSHGGNKETKISSPASLSSSLSPFCQLERVLLVCRLFPTLLRFIMQVCLISEEIAAAVVAEGGREAGRGGGDSRDDDGLSPDRKRDNFLCLFLLLLLFSPSFSASTLRLSFLAHPFFLLSLLLWVCLSSHLIIW